MAVGQRALQLGTSQLALPAHAGMAAQLMSYSRAVVPGDQTPNFGGCYLSVVSQGQPEEAKFAKEFFRKVESTQGYVAWTDEAFAEDASYRTTTKLGYVALMVVLTAVTAFAGYVVWSKWMK